MQQYSYYSDKERFLVAVDCIIFGFDSEGLKLLLLNRNFEPARGKFSLMGGFLDKGENTDAAAARVLESLTGLTDVYMEQLSAFGNVSRDPGDRVISIAYYALINIEEQDDDSIKKHNAFWVNYEEVPDLIFDHNEMVKKALRRLRRKAAVQPVGFNLLPEKFTLTQLQKLYEAIYQTELDKRNFRKKILTMDVLEKLEEKDKLSSRRGAFLYRFDEEKYHRFEDERLTFGINFLL